MYFNWTTPLISILAVLAVSSFSGAAWAANPGAATTTTGQTLTVQIDSPLDGASVSEGALTVTGKALLGTFSANTAVQYVIDVSGSTGSPSGMDCNGDGVVNAGDNLDGTGAIGTTLDCEVSGVLTLNQTLVDIGGVQVGLVTFSDAAQQRDLDPTVAGTQAFTTPGADANHDGIRDLNAATRPLTAGGTTHYDAALSAMNAGFAGRPAGEQHVAFFLSDGTPTPPGSFTTAAGSPLTVAAAAGTKIYTYSVGTSGAGCGPTSALERIATLTGGTCTVVTNPSALTNVLAGTTPAGITGVEVFIDGAAPALASLDALGNFTADTSIAGPGPHTIQAIVTATELTTATAEVAIEVLNPNADLSIVKTTSQTSVRTGDEITYNLVIGNAGPANATGVVVTDNIPSSTSFVSAGSSQGACAYAAPTLSCNLGNVPNGGMVSVTVVVRPNTSGLVVNTASVTGNQPDPTPANSSSSVTVTVSKQGTELKAQPALLSVLNGSLLNLTLRFEARLTNGGVAMPNNIISFSVGSRRCTGITNANGVATCSLTLSRLLAVTLLFGYDASFDGGPFYLSATAHGPVVQIGGLKLF